jgi:hypothetical protein
VREHVRVIIGRQQCIDWHRHDAGEQGTQEGHGQINGVLHHQQDALFGMQTECPQTRCETPDPLIEFAIAELGVIVTVGELAGAICVQRQ